MEKLQEKFQQEAIELIDDLEKAVLLLEQEREDHSQREEVFRVMHTFKGTAKMFGFDQIGEFTHYLENIFDDLRNEKINLTDEILEVSLSAVDHIRSLLNLEHQQSGEHEKMMDVVKRLSLQTTDSNTTNDNHKNNGNVLYLINFKPSADFIKDGNNPLYLIDDLSALGGIYCKAHVDRVPGFDEYQPDNTYLYWDILLYTPGDVKSIRNEFMFVEDRCELLINKIGHVNLISDTSFCEFVDKHQGELTSDIVMEFQQQKTVAVAVPKQTQPGASGKSTSQTIKVTYEKIDKLMSIVSELVTTQARLSLYADGKAIPELEEISENVEKLVRQLRDEVFSISLLPISHLSMRFERLMRDTSRALDKKIRFVTIGGETELDKKIIENLMDPMLHILRNSMDHGIETPEERRLKGKDETGTIQLKAYYSGTNVIIEIEDDGAGINKERVWQKAFQKGLVKEGQQITDRELFDLIFYPGFSTAAQVTDVSGRGVGMDVVSKAVKNLRGEIEVDSWPNNGSVIKLKLPLSLSIIDGLLVKISETTYVIPLTAIDKCYEVERTLIKPDMHSLLVLDGEQVPYINLREIFNCRDVQPAYVNLIVARHEERKVVFEVDKIIDEYQAVIKPLGKIYKDQDFASGATILGNGTVAIVLDTNRLIAGLSEN